MWAAERVLPAILTSTDSTLMPYNYLYLASAPKIVRCVIKANVDKTIGLSEDEIEEWETAQERPDMRPFL